MSTNEILIILCIAGLIIYLIYRSSKKDGTIIDKPDYKTTNINPLQNQRKKPSDDVIAWKLNTENYNLYTILKKEIEKIGTPDLLWRGSENGWVLSIKEDNGRTGSVILAKEKLVGQLGMTRNQLFGMRTDERFPTIFKDDSNFNLIRGSYEMTGRNFEKIEIN